ncbi:YggU family protein [Patescibacteria group bacterium]|nr:YggU family protein [Patescibacteria group bacterium]MBU2259227.1 YggU family protein [Patescibacteria group bacterium]
MFEALVQELAENGSVRFYVRAVPNAPQTKVIEVMSDESVKIAVAVPAEKGKANRELVKFLKKEFGGNVDIVSGQSSRIKLIRVIS